LKSIPVRPPSPWPNRIRTCHKWLSLFVGLQIAIWMLSGLYMASISINVIHGDHLINPVISPLNHQRVVTIPSRYQNLTSVSLTSRDNQPIYIIDSLTKTLALDALTGDEIVIDRDYITERAIRLYSQKGSLLSVELLPRYPSELGGRQRPIWKTVFDDDFSPTLYFSHDTGEFIKARSDLWRWFDILWMLHIMDYPEAEDVNNLLLTFSILLALLTASFGIWLIFYSFSKRQKSPTTLTFLRVLHKWSAMIVGIQILLWIISGLIFNLLSNDKVNLNHQLQSQPVEHFQPHQLDFSMLSKRFPLADHINAIAKPAGLLVNISQYSDLQTLTLATLIPSQISEQQARELAKKSYYGGVIRSVIEVDANHLESRQLKRDLWQVNYIDTNNTALYIDAKTGELLTLKDDNWRLKDLFWMLHIMDYSQRSNFNNILLITAASLASFMSLSGLLMLCAVFSWRDFIGKPKIRQFNISVFSGSQNLQTHLVTGQQPLLHALKEQDVLLPSGCGGGGTCCQCMIIAPQANQPLTSQERNGLSMAELNQKCRLACQLQVDQDLTIELTQPDSQQVTATIVSSEFKTPFIKEVVVRLPPNHRFTFSAGQYVNIEIPTFSTSIGPQLTPHKYRQHWATHNLTNQHVNLSTSTTRSYSLASSSDNTNTLVLNVKLALPTRGYGLGIASSYICSLPVGSNLNFSGPYGDFTTTAESTKELILIGAGSGMAPLKSHIDSLLSQRCTRKISFWFGARSQDDIFYQTHFDSMSRRHNNFNWHVSLSKPLTNVWRGKCGYIQQALFEELKLRQQLGNIEFLVCGPPAMMRDIRVGLQRLGVAASAIKYDDFS